uniref:Uncharacterized protein n=1 Tax=Arundo donax TaxID=35708 RepID=A0A0A8Z4L7_ARUDO
MAYSRNKQY